MLIYLQYSWLLWIMLQWTWKHRFFYRFLFQLFWIEPHKWDCIIISSSILNFWGNSILWSIVVIPNYITTNSVTRVPFSLYPWQHFLYIYVFITTILLSESWYLIMVSICIFQVINNIEQLLDICLSIQEKCLFISFTFLKI